MRSMTTGSMVGSRQLRGDRTRNRSLWTSAVGALALASSGCKGDPAPEGREGDRRDVVFVANAAEGTVSIVDAVGFREIRRLDVTPDDPPSGDDDVHGRSFPILQSVSGLNEAQDLDLSPDGSVLYVSRAHRGDVAAFEVATGAMLWSQPIRGFRADHMTISPNGDFIYVSDLFENRVHVIDTATGQSTATVSTGMWPHDNQVTPDGKYVLNTSIGLITGAVESLRSSIFTALGMAFESPAPVDLAALGIDPASVPPPVSPNALGDYDDLHLITAFEVEPPHAIREVYRFDPGGGLPPQFARGVRPNKVSSDGRFLYAQLSDFKGVIEYDLQERRVTASVELPAADEPAWVEDDRYLGIFRAPHHGLAMSDDEKTLCLAARADNKVFLVSRDPMQPLAALEVGEGPGWAATGPGDHCYVTNEGSNSVSVISYESHQEVARIPVGEGPRHMSAMRVRRSVICPNGDDAPPC